LLRIDLLPRHFAVARVNKLVMAVMILILIVAMLFWGGMVMATGKKINAAEQRYQDAHGDAEKVRTLERETKAKEAELAPIAAKVDFVGEADRSGEQFWDRFHAITRFIYERAQVSRMAITPPGSVNFDAVVGDTTECARFVLNLIQCPALTQVSVSGLPAGVSIAGAGGRAAAVAAPAGMAGMEPGMEMEAEQAVAEEAGMGGPMGGGAPTAAAAVPGEIHLSISAQLVEPVSEPMPPGGAAPAAGPAPPGAGAGPTEATGAEPEAAAPEDEADVAE
jgi:hypothetical protein